MRDETYDLVFEEALGQMLLRHTHLRLIVFDPIKEVIVLSKMRSGRPLNVQPSAPYIA